MNKKQQKHKARLRRYRQFLREIGVGTPELQQLFAEAVRTPSFAELLVLEESDFFPPATWTTEQEGLFMKMLARAAVTAKRQGHDGEQVG